MRCLVAIPLLCLAAPTFAQAHLNCPERPATLAAMRDCYRPLLVFAPGARDARAKEQQSILDKAADDLVDRNILFVPFFEHAQGYSAPLDAPSAVLPAREEETVRRRFHIAPGEFRVILLGEDGGEKLASGEPFSIEKLDATIDAMPTRRRELRLGHND